MNEDERTPPEPRKKKPARPVGVLHLPLDAELKELIGQKAAELSLAMNEWVASVVAERLDRPDLAKIPRKPYGRPRSPMPPLPAA